MVRGYRRLTQPRWPAHPGQLFVGQFSDHGGHTDRAPGAHTTGACLSTMASWRRDYAGDCNSPHPWFEPRARPPLTTCHPFGGCACGLSAPSLSEGPARVNRTLAVNENQTTRRTKTSAAVLPNLTRSRTSFSVCSDGRTARRWPRSSKLPTGRRTVYAGSSAARSRSD